MLRGRNLKQAHKPSGSSSMPSVSPRFDFSGYFKVFIPQARWFIIIGTFYNSLFLQSALQSFFSPYCVPCLPSPATIIGFGGGGISFPKEKKVFLIWGTCWGFTCLSPLLSFFWSHSLWPSVTFFTFYFFAPTQTCTCSFPTSVLRSHTAPCSGPTSTAGSFSHRWSPAWCLSLGIPLVPSHCWVSWVREPGMMPATSTPCCGHIRDRSYHLHLQLHLLRS